MKFDLRTAADFYTEDNAARLKSLGFKFESRTDVPYWVPKKNLSTFHWEKPQRKVLRQKVTVEISSVEDLVKFSRKWGHLLLATKDSPSLTIYQYDDWGE